MPKLRKADLEKQIKDLEQEIEQLQSINRSLKEDIVQYHNIESWTWREAFKILVGGLTSKE